MDINSISSENLKSIQNAVGMVMLKKSMNKDSQTAIDLIASMGITNQKILEQSVAPHKGTVIDVKI